MVFQVLRYKYTKSLPISHTRVIATDDAARSGWAGVVLSTPPLPLSSLLFPSSPRSYHRSNLISDTDAENLQSKALLAPY